MIVISLTNKKGGVGKTTSVHNLGAYLSQKFKVLMVDMDSQADLTKACGVTLKEVENLHVGHLLLKKATFDEVVLEDKYHLLPSHPEFQDMEIELFSQTMFHDRLQRILKGQPYDYVLIDCPPALGASTTCALFASNFFFVPMQAGYFSYEGLATLLQWSGQFSEYGCQFGGVFATQYHPNARYKLGKEMVDSAREQLGNRFLETFIRTSTALENAQARGKDIFEYEPNSNGANDYATLAEEIISITKHSIA